MALGLGLLAAICWGIHDICVRQVSQGTPLAACLLIVLIAGTIFHMIVMTITANFQLISVIATGYAALSGVFFLIASLGLYAAFQRGPVRLVAPIIASYPIISVTWAAIRGSQISATECGAVIAIVIGVSIVAALSDESDGKIPSKGLTVLYALIASVGFAGTFATGQYATELSHEAPVVFITRLIAITLLLTIMFGKKLPFSPGRKAVPILVVMGCLDGIALLCVVAAGSLQNAEYAAVASSTFGLLTIVMAWAFLKERMTTSQWGGVAIAFAGIGYLAI